MFTIRKGVGLGCSLVLACLINTSVARADSDLDALRAAVMQEQDRPKAPQFDRSALMVRAGITGVTLSPDGKHVAYLKRRGNEFSVWLLATDTLQSHQILPRTDAGKIDWTRDSRWLLLESPRQLFALAAAGQPGSGIVTRLGGPEERRVVGVDMSAGAAVIVREHSPGPASSAASWRLLRTEVGGKHTLLREDTNKIVDVALDSEGRLAFVVRVEGDSVILYRIDSEGMLQPVRQLRPLERISLISASESVVDSSLSAANAGRPELLLRGELDGSLSRLLSIDADGALQVLHGDPEGEADLDELVLDPMTQQPLIASYRSTRPHNHGLTPELQRSLDALNRTFPHRDLHISVGSEREAGAKMVWLVGERDSTLHGERWHLYTPATETLRTILADTPPQDPEGNPRNWLPETSLARQIPIAYPASDGMRLHGFVWIPAGIEVSKAPLVANIHGGPWSAIRPGFSKNAQLLANKGYVVFEPNYRGSTNLGRDYMLAAKGDFGNGRVLKDMVDGVRYLLANGVGDAENVAITGGSFGGYATLLGLTFSPDVFKVGVAVVPPPDLSWDMRWVARNQEALTLSDVVPFESWLRMSAIDLNDKEVMDRLHQQSPLANVEAMTRPLLMVAGGEDRRVDIASVIEYASRLKLLGRDVSLLVEKEAGHTASGAVAQEATLYLLERMLQRHLGGHDPEPPSEDLRAYINRNMRIAGGDFQHLATDQR